MRVSVTVCALFLLAACDAERGASTLPSVLALSPADVRQVGVSYSPDGKRVAYWMPAHDSTANWQLWVANADMTAPVNMNVTSATPDLPIWSQNASMLAITSNAFGVSDVAVVPAAGGALKRVTTGGGFKQPLAWYPDGDRLACFGTAPGGTFKSFVVSVRTGVTTPLVPGEKLPNLGSPSPDGSHVAYFAVDGSKATIWVADSMGNNPRQLTTEGFETLVQFHEWSPNGKELLYESRRTGTADLWIVPIDGGKARQLTHDVRNDFGGAWSPDGKWVAFLSYRGKQTDLWVVPAAGGEPQRLTDDAVEETDPLIWRPGTNSIAFTTRNQQSGLWAMDLADGKERRLTPDSVRTPFFNVSPDGKQVDYVIDHGGGIQDLAVIPLGGGASRVLIQGGGSINSPWWSPDGTRIVFDSDRGGTNDAWVVDAAGGAPRQLENWPGFETAATWNADGSAIYFLSDRETRLGDVWKVPVSGGEPVRLTHDGSLIGINSHAGVTDIFVSTVGSRAGEFALARVGADGKMHAVWDRSSINLESIAPRGDSLAAQVEQPDGKLRSMIISATTGAGRVILKPDDEVGVWSNDGKWLLYLLRSAGTTDYGMLNVADGTTRRLTTTKEDEKGAEFTPDGKTIVFRRSKTVQRIFTVDLTKLMAAADKY